MSLPWPPAGTRPMAVDVVSVQSQVVYGRVGNNVALPTLHALGLVTAAVPTVCLSNTPHYPSMHGGAIPADWFAGFLDDLIAREALHALRAVQSGYLGSPAQAEALAHWIARLRESHDDLRVVVDPVLGDHDHGVYVDPALVTVCREQLAPQATGLVPNSFEITQLAQSEPRSMRDTVAAARSLLRGNTQWVVVTSAAPGEWPQGQMQLALVTREGAWTVTHPLLDATPKGTGDLFCAGLVGHWLSGNTLPEAVRSACALVLQALRRTQQAHCAELLLPDTTAALPVGDEIRLERLSAV